MSTEVQQQWFTKPQAAVYSGISQRELSRLIASGRLKASKINSSRQGAVRIRRTDLDALLEGSPAR